MAVPPSAKDMTVLTLRPGAGYHIGCPISALVAMEDGAAPKPVEIAKVDPEGGVSAEVRKAGEDQMKQHKIDKKDKVKDKHYRSQP
jgi:hypothetical protein